MIHFTCASCAAQLQAPDRLASGKTRCPRCKTVQAVPAMTLAATVVSAPAAELSAESATLPPSINLENPATPPITSEVATVALAAAAANATLAWTGSVAEKSSGAALVPGYEILGELGRGGMGVVYKARQSKLNRLVALKMILAGGHAGAADLARFHTEAEAIARLQHPNIVQVHEVGEHEGKPYFSLEFCGGGSLTEKLNGTPLPPRAAAALVETLARAMQAAHDHQIIHRDLKPANVMLTEEGELKITDFGLAKKLDEAGQTHSGAIMGTPSYMAPEQAGRQSHHAGPLTDVYALGAILYECLTGRPPFKATSALDTIMQVMKDEPVSPSHLQTKTPRDLETICLKCLRKEPTKRYASAAALAEDLRCWQAGEPIAARPVGRVERTVKWVQRRPAAAALLLLAALFLAGLVVVPVVIATQQSANATRLANEQQKTQHEQRKTELALVQSQESERKAIRQAAESALDRAIQLCDNNDLPGGLQSFARSLALARQAGADDLEDACRWNLGAWSREVHALAQTYKHPGRVWATAFSPDGKLLATGCEDGRLRLFELRTGKQLSEKVHPQAIMALAFHPTKPQIVTTSHDGLLRVWDLDKSDPAMTVRFQAPFPATDGPNWYTYAPVVYSPDGSQLLVGGRGNVAFLRDAATGQVLRRFHESPTALGDWVRGVAFSPDGRQVLAVGRSGRAFVWNIDNGEAPVLSVNLPSGGSTGAWAPNGKTFVTTHETDQSIQSWDATTGKPVGPRLRQTGTVSSIVYNPAGNWVASGSQDGTVRLWDAESEQPFGQTLMHPDAVRSVAFSPDGNTVAVACWDGHVYLWRLATRSLRWSRLHPTYVLSLAFSPNSHELAVGMHGDQAMPGGLQIHRWERDTGALLQPLFNGKIQIGNDSFTNGYVTGLEYSRDGKNLYVGSHRHVVRWNAGTAKIEGDLLPGQLPSECTHLALNHDGSRLVVSLHNPGQPHAPCNAYLWNLTHPQQEPWELPFPNVTVSALTFDPAGEELWIATTEPLLKRYRAVDGSPLGDPLPLPSEVNALAFSPDRRVLLLGCKDRVVRQLNPETLEPVGPPLPHPHRVGCVAYAAGGQLIVTGCDDGRVRLWHPATGKRVGPLLTHDTRIETVAVSPDARALASASYSDKLVCLWSLPAPKDGSADELLAWVERMTGQQLEERKIVVQSKTPPDEWLLRLETARAQGREGKWAEAAGFFSEALALKDDAYVRNERGMAYAVQGRWELAAADFTRALEVLPDDYWMWMRAVVVQAQLGNKEAYRHLRRKMLEHFGGTRDMQTADLTAKACSLMPGVLEDWRKVSDLADVAVTVQPEWSFIAYCWLDKGQVEYRAGNYDKANDCLRKSLMKTPTGYSAASASFLLAMTQHQQGQAATAKVTLARAHEITAQQVPTLEHSGVQWHDWLINDLLRREAEALIGEPKQPQK